MNGDLLQHLRIIALLLVLIASIVLICKSLWIKASAKCLNISGSFRARKTASPTSRGYCVFQSGYQMYHHPARRAILNTGQGVFKALKSCKYVKWYKKSLNCNFKRSYSWGWKGKNRDMAGLNFKRQLCHWINMSAARFKVKTRHGCLYVNVSLKVTNCPQKRIIGIFI